MKDKGTGFATWLKTNNQAHSEEQNKFKGLYKGRACARCNAAGRINEAIGHKGSNCAVPIPFIVITDSESENEEASDEDE